tara:strand:- start:434 stop:1603 length:1170 start_codon:yes stop_codon:yes gene_type:complete
MLDINKIRLETPGCQSRIHFNNAGGSLIPRGVSVAVESYLNREQEIGSYEAAEEAKVLINSFYTKFSELLNCSESEIAFIENSTRAWEMAVHSISWKPGDQIITGENEYGSNYLGLLHLAKQRSLKILTIPNDESGTISLSQLEESVTDKTRLIAITHVASQRGDVQPASKVGEIANKHNILYLLDACQSVGQINLDTKSLKCDFLCGSGRKYLRGPRGTGFLYTKSTALKTLEPVFLDLHSANWKNVGSYEFVRDAKMFECWERNMAAMIGLTTAVEYLLKLDVKMVEQRVKQLSLNLREKLSELAAIKILEKSNNCSGIVTFTKTSISATDLKDELQKKGINISVIKQRNARLDLGKECTGDINRASLHYYNSEQEISEFIKELTKL